MRHLNIFVFISLLLLGCTQNNYILDVDAFLDNETGIMLDSGKNPVTGKVKYYDARADRDIEGSTQTTIADAELDKTAFVIAEFDNVKVIHKSSGTTEEGRLKAVLMYKNGKPDGVSKWYHDNGKIFFKTFYKNGKPDGVQKGYYSDGGIRYKFQYKDGKQDGYVYHYYQSGKLMGKVLYKNGSVQGKALAYHENGAIMAVSSYVNGKQDGASIIYHKNGQVEYEFSYKEGRLDGLSRNYYENGKIRYEWFHDKDEGTKYAIPYKGGKRDGVAIYYRPHGIVLEITYSEDAVQAGYCVNANGKRTLLNNEEIIGKDIDDIDCR
jgi:antitoxin component YwqK of YwqJK toxin-antitoxin module